jgi:hypothetical protein
MSTVYEYRDNIKAKLMRKLFGRQLQFWNAELFTLGLKNAISKERDIITSMPYTIFYRNKQWMPVYVNWVDERPLPCTELNLDYPDWEPRMARIADELQDLADEKYEAERFLSALVLFDAPPEAYERILGNTLYSTIAVELKRHCSRFAGSGWELNTEHSLAAYIETHTAVVARMNERLLMNLITLDGSA